MVGNLPLSSVLRDMPRKTVVRLLYQLAWSGLNMQSPEEGRLLREGRFFMNEIFYLTLVAQVRLITILGAPTTKKLVVI
jgi:hypothetical protein